MRRGISGTHRLNGIFMAYGSKIQPGVEIEGASLVDLAPTILRLMNEPDVEAMDGRVLHEIARPGVNLDQAIKRRPGTDFFNGNGHDYIGGTGRELENVLSEEEQKLLADRLRSLGYVG